MKSIDGRVTKLEQRFFGASEHDFQCHLFVMNGLTCPWPEPPDDDPCIQAIHQDPHYRMGPVFRTIEYGVIPGEVNEKTAHVLREHGWVDQRIGTLNHILESRWFVLFSGSFLPRKYALKNNATQSEYDHIHRAMEAEEQGKVTEHQRQRIDRLRREAKELARQNLPTYTAFSVQLS